MVKEGYKQTEIGLIPEDWELKELNEITDDIGDGIHSTPKYCKSGFYSFVNGNNLLNGKVKIFEETKKVSTSEFMLHKRDINKNTIFLSINGTIGNVALFNNEKILLGKSIAYINVKNSQNKAFVYYLIQSSFIKKYFNDELTGSTIKNLGLNSIRKTLIPIPPKEEQKAIAKTLSDTDELITSLEKLISKKEAIKQGTMQQLLTGKKRLNGFSGEWEERNLNDICWFQEGPGLRKWQFTNKGIKVINVTNLVNGYLELDKTNRHISMEEFEKMYKHFEIDENDIVMASSGNSYSKVSIVRKKDLRLVMNTSVIRFKPLINTDYNFLHIFLKSTYFKEQIDLLITGGAQPNFGPFHLNKIVVNIPSTIEEQNKIGQIISDMDNEIESLKSKLSKTKAIKDGIMSELLTGKTRLKVKDE